MTLVVEFHIFDLDIQSMLTLFPVVKLFSKMFCWTAAVNVFSGYFEISISENLPEQRRASDAFHTFYYKIQKS